MYISVNIRIRIAIVAMCLFFATRSYRSLAGRELAVLSDVPAIEFLRAGGDTRTPKNPFLPTPDYLTNACHAIGVSRLEARASHSERRPNYRSDTDRFRDE